MMPAKKGDLAVLRMSRSFTVLHGAMIKGDVYTACIVTKVNTSGRVLEATDKLGIRIGDKKQAFTWLVCRPSDLKGVDPSAIVAAIENEYADLGELRAAIVEQTSKKEGR